MCRAYVSAYRTTDRSLEAHLSSLQSVRHCTVSHARGMWPPPSMVWQGPVDGMPAAPARTALLQVLSNCTRALSVSVQVLGPSNCRRVKQKSLNYCACEHPVYVTHSVNHVQHVVFSWKMLQSPSCKGAASALCANNQQSSV